MLSHNFMAGSDRKANFDIGFSRAEEQIWHLSPDCGIHERANVANLATRRTAA